MKYAEEVVTVNGKVQPIHPVKTLNMTHHKTRPDTRPIPVADGWAGAEMRVFPLFDSSVTDQPTNQPTDRRTDGRTKPLIESLVRD